MERNALEHAAPHGRGLADDLDALARQAQARRRMLGWLASAAGVSLVGGIGSAVAQETVDPLAGRRCVADPEETAGPYPADGTNHAAGSTSDILTSSGIVRSDIRPSFLGSSTIAQGVPLTLTLTVANTNASCETLAGLAIYLWHCDRDGAYSLYTAPAESYLRGVQVTDDLGQVTFTTIFPACYPGRWPHIHFEVYQSLSTATNGRNALLTSQLALPKAICETVYANASGYSASVGHLQAVSLRSDMVFGDNTLVQLKAMTPRMAGSVAAGYNAAATIGLAA
ncbi:MAG: intradiol ring-cleavage dioxygenase [Proteobacteria bacterium]|nr:intradiol ring-cleavage dioxygenase [Pseudomonadota bacterium]